MKIHTFGSSFLQRILLLSIGNMTTPGYNHGMCYSALVENDLKLLKRYLDDPTFFSRLGKVHPDQKVEAKASESIESSFSPRIYPNDLAPILFFGESPQIDLMAYGTDPHLPSGPKTKKYTSFNARRDNLQSPFWKNAFLSHHGFIVLRGFFEWVAVKDLLRAGVVSLDAIREIFAQQQNERRKKLEAAGMPFKPTRTESQDPSFRKVVIQFFPEDQQHLLVPIIFSVNSDGQRGFAVITDEPSPEIRAAGHDRCPIILSKEGIQHWLSARSHAECQQTFDDYRRSSFMQHKLAA